MSEKVVRSDKVASVRRKMMEQVSLRLGARLVKTLLDKGLKAGWNERDFIGFLSVMASLHSQTKDWKFPSIDSYMTLDPQTLSTLVTCLEERRKKIEESD